MYEKYQQKIKLLQLSQKLEIIEFSEHQQNEMFRKNTLIQQTSFTLLFYI